MEVVTFYSYKGGVGRTLLLAWVARALTARGKRVLALDLDLEAPGLPTKLRPVSEPQAGFGVVDLLVRFQGGASPPMDLAQWCLPVTTERGSLCLLPAGAAPSPGYWHTLSRISWESLFVERGADGARFFLWLRNALAKAVEADFLLVDARTGVTEMGAAAVGLLADTVIAVTNTSPESKKGLREVLRAAVGSPRAANRPRLRVLPVLSRVPALLGADDNARLVDQMRRFLNEEGDPLTSTLAVERVVAIHHEEALLEDEQRALVGPRLRIRADYERVLAWLLREAMPGVDMDPSLPRSSQIVEAVRAQEDVIAAYRESAEHDPTLYLPMLADALDGLARNLADLGRREQALATTEEAVAIHRQLAVQWPEISPTLAMGLNNLGARLSELGRREEALAATQEAVAVYRTLAEAHPDAFLPNLAASLNNLGNRLSELGRREDALAAAQEAVAVYRALAEARPDAFLPDLAASLNNLGNRFSESGQREEAVTTTEDAVAVYRTLAEARPDAFLPDLAGSLNNLGNRLSELGRREDALAATQDAVTVYRALAEEHPDAILPDLAGSLNDLGNQLSESGQREETRSLVAQKPDVFPSDLAGSPTSPSARQSKLGADERALMPPATGTASVLFFAANPSTLDELDLVGEIRSIEAELAKVRLGNVLHFLFRPATTPAQLQHVLLTEHPMVVQFSGHGRGSDRAAHRSDHTAGSNRELTNNEPPDDAPTGIMLQGDRAGDIKVVPGAILGDLFSRTEQRIRLVFLNACHSAEQAAALLEHVDFVVGLDGAITDAAAKVFAVAFYRALAFGRTIHAAFGLGVNALMLEGLKADMELPVLGHRKGVDPTKATLVTPCEGAGDSVWDVFISYAPVDRDDTSELARELHDREIRVFFDEWVIGPSDVPILRTDEGIRDSTHGIIVLSTTTMSKPWLPRQYAALLDKSVTQRKKLIPVLVGDGDVELAPFLRTIRGVDLRGKTGAVYEKELDAIVMALRGQRPGPPPRRR